MNTTFQKLTVLLIVTAALTAKLEAEPRGWLEYKQDNWPAFVYPPSFKLNSRSFGGVHQKDEGTLRISILTSPDTDLQIISSNYGFIPDIHRSIGGFENPRDVLLAGLSGDPFRIRRVQESSYEVFRVMGDTNVKVYFLMRKPAWGQCFEFLEFIFERGSYSRHSETIDKVVKSFKPSFSVRAKK